MPIVNIEGLGQMQFPDDMSQEQIANAIETDVMPRVRREKLVKSNPGEYDPQSTEFQTKYGPQATTFGENLSAGVGKAFVDTYRGLKQLSYAMPQTQLFTELTGIGKRDRADNNAAINQAKVSDAPLMTTGGGMTGYIGGQLSQFALPGGAASKVGGAALNALPRLARGAAVGAGIANTQPVAEGETRIGNTAFGATAGAAGEGVASLFGRLATGSKETISPAVKKLAERAKEFGIPLRAEQLTGNRALAGLSAALDTVPFSGRSASRDAQRVALNKAISGTFGESTPNITEAINLATKRLVGEYDSVLGKYAVKVDDVFVNEMDDILRKSLAELPEAQGRVISRQVDEILGKVQSNGTIDGQVAYNIKKAFDRIGKNNELKHYIGELRSSLYGALDRSLPADVAKGFAKTREQYSNLIVVRKIFKDAAEGYVTPARLANAKARGDLGELGRIGQQFLTEPFGNSGTANRIAGLGVLGGLGAGAAFNPVLAGQVALTGATLGRGANAALGSNALRDYILHGSNALRVASDKASYYLPTAGAIASQ